MNTKPAPSLRVPQIRTVLERCPPTVVGEVLGLERRTVRVRIDAGEYPDQGAGRTDLFKAAAAERRRARGGIVSIEAQRLKRAQADKAELEAARLRREVLDAAEVAEVVTEILASIVRGMESLASRIGPIVDNETDPAKRREAIQHEIRAAREAAARELESLGARAPRVEDSPPAAG